MKQTFLLLTIIGFFTLIPISHARPLNPTQPTSTESVSPTLTQRPKVAVVLAGGGAKGMAHIGALKEIEAAGIPIDMVVGNSMGAIVGGLYSLGYTPDEMQEIVSRQDWAQLLLDNPDYGDQGLKAKKLNEHYLLRVPLDRRRLEQQGAGVIQGVNIDRLLRELTYGLPDSIDFNTLPIPFCCVATDVVRGRIHEFHNGDLVTAMRSSMAIPGVFTPVSQDSMLFVDGFILNNFPTDVAKAMGADIIIGLDLVSNIPATEKMDNIVDMFTHIVEVTSSELYHDNIDLCDIYISADVTGYHAASFSTQAIDTLILRGKQSVQAQQTALIDLRQQLCQGNNTAESLQKRPMSDATECPHLDAFFKHKNAHKDQFRTTQKQRSLTQTVRDSYESAVLNLGARFDNDEFASVQLAATLPISAQHDTYMGLYLRLGTRFMSALSFNRQYLYSGNCSLSYTYEHNDLDYFHHGHRMTEMSLHHHKGALTLGQSWNQVQYSYGLLFDYYRYEDVLFNNRLPITIPDLSDEHYFTYFAAAEFNNLDSQYFPTIGNQFKVRAEFISSNLLKYHDNNIFPILSGSWQSAVSFNSRFTIIPNAAARIIINNGQTPWALQNTLGGLYRGMQMPHQMTMAGLANMECVERSVITAGLRIHQRVGGNHFLIGAIDGASISPHIEDALTHNTYTWGVNIGYSYRSMAGPLSLALHWSERSRDVIGTVNIGYYF